MNMNNNTVKWVSIITLIFLSLFSLSITFSRINASKITDHDTSIAVIENELKHINSKLDELLEAVK